MPVTWPTEDTAYYEYPTTQAHQPTDPRTYYSSPSTSSDGSTIPSLSYASGESYQMQHQEWPTRPGPSTSGIMGNLGSEWAKPSAHRTLFNTPYGDTSSSRMAQRDHGPSPSPAPYPHPYRRHRTVMPPSAESVPFESAEAESFGQAKPSALHRLSRTKVRRTRQAVGHAASSNPTLPAQPSVFHSGPPMEIFRASDHLAAEIVVPNRPVRRGAAAITDNTQSIPLPSGSRPYSRYNAAPPFYPHFKVPSQLSAQGLGQQRMMGESYTAETLSVNHHTYLPPHPLVHLPVPAQPDRRVAGPSRILRSTTQAGRSQVTRIDTSLETSGGGRKRKQRDDDEDSEGYRKRKTGKWKAGASIPATRPSTKGKERDEDEAAQIRGKQAARAPRTRMRIAQPKPDNDHDYVDNIPGMPRYANVDVVPGMSDYVPNKENKKKWGCLPGCMNTQKTSKGHDGSAIPSTFNRQVDRNRHFHTVNSHRQDREQNTERTCPFAGCGQVLSRQDAVKRHLSRTHKLPPLEVLSYMRELEEDEDGEGEGEEYPRAKRPRGGR